MRTLLVLLIACGAQNPPESESDAAEADAPAIDAAEADASETDAADAAEVDAAEVETGLASVTAVVAQGDGLAVTIQSPDTGCAQYANWWEVVTEDGALVYRRILGHSHVDEQPFTRSGGPVDVDGNTTLIVRAHMAPGGYGGSAFRGTLSEGFEAAPDIGADFAPGLEEEAPLPSSCAF
ncbi:MAG: hypothetical protein AB8H86_21060 [Polyangiales bacterium]